MTTLTEKRTGTLVWTLAPWAAASRTVSLHGRGGMALPARLCPGASAAGLRALTDKLAAVCAEVYHVSREDIYGPGRQQPLAEARAAILWTLRQMPDHPGHLVCIRLLRRCQAGSSMHLIRKAERLRASDACFRGLTDQLKALLPE